MFLLPPSVRLRKKASLANNIAFKDKEIRADVADFFFVYGRLDL